MLVSDQEGRIVAVNTQAEQMFGYLHEEFLGLTVDDLVPEDIRPKHSEHRARYMARPRTRPMGAGVTLQARRRDGTTFSAEITLSYFEERKLVMSAVRDVTDRMRAEEERQRNLETARMLSEQREDLVSIMTHNVKTPIATIIGYAEALDRDLELEMRHRFCETIIAQARSLDTLFGDLMKIMKYHTAND